MVMGENEMLAFISGLLGLSLIGAIGYMLYHDHELKKSGNKTEVPIKKRWQLWAIIVAIIVVINLIPSDPTDESSTNVSDRSESEKTSKVEKDDSSKDDDSNEQDTDDTDSSEIDTSEVDKNIKMLLKDDQKDASNGNDKYAYALYIKKIKYSEDGIDIQVASNFFDLSSADKDVVAEKVQGVVGAGISMVDSDYKPKDDQEGYHLNFHYGQIAVGHSKMWNSHKYKWYKSAG